MKQQKLIAIALLGIGLGFSSCEKKPIYVDFQTNSTFLVTVPANSLISTPLSLLETQQTSDAEGQYTSHDTRKDLLQSVTMKSFLLEVETPANDDLSALQKIQFFINADGIVEAVFAQKDPVAADVGSELLLDLPSVDLAPYLKKDTFELRTHVVTDENRTQDLTMKATLKFQVRAEVIEAD